MLKRKQNTGKSGQVGEGRGFDVNSLQCGLYRIRTGRAEGCRNTVSGSHAGLEQGVSKMGMGRQGGDLGNRALTLRSQRGQQAQASLGATETLLTPLLCPAGPQSPKKGAPYPGSPAESLLLRQGRWQTGKRGHQAWGPSSLCRHCSSRSRGFCSEALARAQRKGPPHF